MEVSFKWHFLWMWQGWLIAHQNFVFSPWDSIIAEDQLPSKGLYFPASLLQNGATWLVVNCGMWTEVPWVTSRPWLLKLGMVSMIFFFLPPLDPKVEDNPRSHMMKLAQSRSAYVPNDFVEHPCWTVTWVRNKLLEGLSNLGFGCVGYWSWGYPRTVVILKLWYTSESLGGLFKHRLLASSPEFPIQ